MTPGHVRSKPKRKNREFNIDSNTQIYPMYHKIFSCAESRIAWYFLDEVVRTAQNINSGIHLGRKTYKEIFETLQQIYMDWRAKIKLKNFVSLFVKISRRRKIPRDSHSVAEPKMPEH